MELMYKHVQNEYFDQITFWTSEDTKIKLEGFLADINIFDDAIIDIIELHAAITSIMSIKGSPNQRLQNYLGLKQRLVHP